MLEKDVFDLETRVKELEQLANKSEYNRLLEFFSFKAMSRIDQLAYAYNITRVEVLLRGLALLSIGSNLKLEESLAIIKDGKIVKELNLDIEEK
jgi:hypothetical protein